MSCKKIFYYEITATLEEEFDSVEKATNQNHASDNAVVKEITQSIVTGKHIFSHK